MDLERTAERLEEDQEVLELEEVQFEESGYFSHTGFRAIGHGSSLHRDYDLRLNYDGAQILIRASSESEVYHGRVKGNIESPEDLEEQFEDIVEEAELNLSYR